MAVFKLPNLLPKENKFGVLLEDLAVHASTCAKHLKTYVESRDVASKQQAAAAISDARAKAKTIATDMTRELCLTFITPFDREDIQDISEYLYKIPKTIEKVKDRMEMHELSMEKNDFSHQVDLIVLEAEAMETMVRDMVSKKNIKNIQEKITILYDLEHKGDVVLGQLLVSLFKNSRDSSDLILRKDIYDMLEKIIDRYRDAAGVALKMVLKHT